MRNFEKTNKMTTKEELRVRWLIYFYGGHILEAMMLDEILEDINNRGMLQYSFERIPSKSEKDLIQNLDFLVKEGYLKSYSDNHYNIEQKGKLHLSSGGFTTEAKKAKNSLYAFRVSIIAITIAILSALSSFFGWFHTSR